MIGMTVNLNSVPFGLYVIECPFIAIYANGIHVRMVKSGILQVAFTMSQASSLLDGGVRYLFLYLEYIGGVISRYYLTLRYLRKGR